MATVIRVCLNWFMTHSHSVWWCVSDCGFGLRTVFALAQGPIVGLGFALRDKGAVMSTQGDATKELPAHVDV